MNSSTVTIRETKQSKIVEISSDSKPKLSKEIIDKWQSLIDIVAKIANVSSGVIMRLNKTSLDVFLSSKTKGNPFEVGKQMELNRGLYCETVIGVQKELLIPNATTDKIWKENNPGLDLNMISYLGFPVNWPDGEVFGTVCILDNKENHYSYELIDLLKLVKQQLEADLQILLLAINLKLKNTQLEQLNNVKSRFLSLISHDVRGMIGTLDEFLKLILKTYDEYDKLQLKPILSSLSRNASTSFQTLENLLLWAKNDFVNIKLDKVELNLVDVTENLLNTFEQAILLKNLSLKREYASNDVFINADEKMMYVILRNILSNAIKYTNRGGVITVRLFQSEKQSIIEIEDTGVGMDKYMVDNLFSYNEAHSIKGTDGESSAGIGLMLAKEFMLKNNISFVVKSEVGKGTMIRLLI